MFVRETTDFLSEVRCFWSETVSCLSERVTIIKTRTVEPKFLISQNARVPIALRDLSNHV